MRSEEILRSYPYLEHQDLLVALDYGARASDRRRPRGLFGASSSRAPHRATPVRQSPHTRQQFRERYGGDRDLFRQRRDPVHYARLGRRSEDLRAHVRVEDDHSKSTARTTSSRAGTCSSSTPPMSFAAASNARWMTSATTSSAGRSRVLSTRAPLRHLRVRRLTAILAACAHGNVQDLPRPRSVILYGSPFWS